MRRSSPTGPKIPVRKSHKSTSARPSSQALTSTEDANSLHYGLRHYPQTDLIWTTESHWLAKSQTLLCYDKAVHAIVFVHGWGGSAGDTWEMFPKIVAKAAPNADIFFLDYPSTQSQVSFCAAQLRRFLEDLVGDPMHKVIVPSLPRNAPRREQATRYENFPCRPFDGSRGLPTCACRSRSTSARWSYRR